MKILTVWKGEIIRGKKPKNTLISRPDSGRNSQISHKITHLPEKPLPNPKNYSQNTSNFPINKKIQNYPQHKTDENLLNIDGIIAGIFPNE
jgi:hypothetical protein